MSIHNFLFDNLPAHQLLPHLFHLINHSSPAVASLPWQVCWLNNDGQQVIGLLPKVAWTVYPATDTSVVDLEDGNLNFEIVNTQRQDSKLDSVATNTDCAISLQQSCEYLNYHDWINELVGYAQAQTKTDTQSQPPFKNNNQQDQTQQNSNQQKNSQPQPSYHNGLMGFIGYDIGAKVLSPNSALAVADQPCAFLGHYDIYLTPIAATQSWQLQTHADTSQAAKSLVIKLLQQLEAQLQCSNQQTACSFSRLPQLPLTATWTQHDYQTAFAQTQHYLYQGDSYQINLTQKWHGQLSQAPHPQYLLNYLPNLHQQTQAPFAGYLAINTPSDKAANQKLINETSLHNQSLDFELLSCSPELFVMFDKTINNEQRILTKPIKGTLPRGKTPEQDEQLKQQLANSEKDQAENVMIVDLLRNDLGKYATSGSVQVPKLFAIESFSNVHHMVSSITATIRPEIHPLTVLFDSLPAGSITGTPKKRAVEIISELEAAPRGAYCGSLGFLNFDGTGQWNVLIRSLQANAHGDVALWAGGGITVGSQCDLEYQECLDKVSNLLAILETASTDHNPPC